MHLLVFAKNVDSDPVGLDSAFLISSQVMPGLLVHAPHLNSKGHGPTPHFLLTIMGPRGMEKPGALETEQSHHTADRT